LTPPWLKTIVDPGNLTGNILPDKHKVSIVFVHGSGGCADIWRYQTAYFPDSHAVSLPGHPDGQILKSVEGCVDWLKKYIDGKALKDVILAGHSFGGAITLMYELRYPHELKGIIVIGSGARLRVHPAFLAICEEAVKGNLQKWYEMVEEMNRSTPEDYRSEIIEKQKTIGPAAMLNDFLCCDKFDIMNKIHEVKLPALIVCGELDVMTPVKYANYLGAKMANSKVVVVPQAGHFVFAEKPEAVNKAIEDFVGGLSS
jgi:pimeloyl-ACP methyl ester carboxylesterase